MPIITMQRRLVEVGRIRMGEKRTSRSGTKFPAKLDTWRITSSDKQRLDAAAVIYGGTVTDWEGQWQLTTTTNVLDVAVVPGQAVSQFMEHWGQRHPKSHDGPNPVVCLFRCDGQTELLADRPCPCIATQKDVCKPTTRLSVMLRKVPGMGLWRLDTRGENAARELIGSVELLEMLTEANNRPVRARLRLDQRSSIDEKGETHHFVVPVLDIDTTMDDALDALQATPLRVIDAASGEVLQLPTPAPAPAFTPVPAELPAPAPSIADQVAAAQEPKPRSARAGAQQPIKGTGVQPRTAAEAGESSPAESSEGGGPLVGQTSDTEGDPARDTSGDAVASTPDEPDPDPGEPVLPFHVQVIRWCEEAGLGEDGRHRFLLAFSQGAYSSSRQVPSTGDVVASLRATLVRYKQGKLQLVERDGSWILTFGETGFEAQHPEGDGTADTSVLDSQPALELVDGDWWREQLKAVPGVGPVKLTRKAQELAAELGVNEPGNVGQITDPALVAACRTWLAEQAAS